MRKHTLGALAKAEVVIDSQLLLFNADNTG